MKFVQKSEEKLDLDKINTYNVFESDSKKIRFGDN